MGRAALPQKLQGGSFLPLPASRAPGVPGSWPCPSSPRVHLPLLLRVSVSVLLLTATLPLDLEATQIILNDLFIY